MSAPWLVYIVAFVTVIASSLGILILPEFVKRGHVAFEQIPLSIVYDLSKIVCAIGLVRMERWPVYVMAGSSLIAITIAGVGGAPLFRCEKLLAVGAVPLMFVGVSCMYWRRLR